MLLILPFAYSQDMEQVLKERKEISKMTRSELDARASKSARKEARKYEKEGWQVAPGQLPLEKQLDRLHAFLPHVRLKGLIFGDILIGYEILYRFLI